MTPPPNLPASPDSSQEESVLERITVSLAPKVAEDLGRLQARRRLSKTDAVNRAISLYEFVDSLTSQGDEVWVRHRGSGEQSRIQFL